jgi:hypothetical protein
MLRSIYRKLLGTFKTDGGRKTRRGARPRRLTLENLESRKLLTTTLTYNAVSDGSFEAPALPLGAYQLAPNSQPWQFAGTTYQIAPSSLPWQFTGIAGVSSNGSAFTSGNPNAPAGMQVAFIKNGASMSQTVSLDAGVYNVSFLASQRVNYQTQDQQIEILMDGAEVGVIVPAGVVAPTNIISYVAYQTWNFTVAAGTHTVTFLGMSPSTADSTAFIDEVAIVPVVDTIVNAGFEQPSLPPNAYQTDPTGSAWKFSGTAGISRNGSDFVTNWVEAQNAPVGAQVGYIQENGSMSQTVYLDAGTYQLSFLAAQRAIYQTSYQVVEILVDSVPAGTFNPVNTLYGSYQSSTFTVPTGSHTIEFLGLNPQGGDNTVFVDQVALTANAIDDGSFEIPAINAGAYQYAPGGSSWQFAGLAGVASNGSAFTNGNPGALDGTQVAFIQGNGSIGQSVNLVAGSYSISFVAAQRGNTPNQSQEIEILVDGAQVGLISPVSTSYYLYQTLSFSVTAGMHDIEFLGMNPQGGDNTALLDELALGVAQNQVSDAGFETPVLAGGTYQVAPSGTPWQFSGPAGISANGSPVTSGNPNAPQGGQVAYIANNGSMTQAVYLDAGTYNVSFVAAQRVNSQTEGQQIKVLIDGAQVGLIMPTSNTYTLYQTSNFTVAAGVHTLQFLGMTPPSGQSAALLDFVAVVTTENTIIDGSFETPVLAANTYAVAPSGSGWQFSGSAGVSTNDSAFTNGSAYAPTGSQVAFLKNNAAITQPVYLDAGAYNISFLATQRINFQTQSQQIKVLVDGAQVGLFTPASAVSQSTGAYIFTPYQTSNFSVAAGTHTVQFLGMTPPGGDSTAFIDSVAIAAGYAIGDGSFEETALAPATYQVAPSGTPWQFSGTAGVSTDNSGFTMGNPNAPVGGQVAFIKDNGSLSQSVYLAAGFYNLSFMAAQRLNYQASYESLNIFVDGVQVGTATPASSNYGLYQTSNFTVSAGVHTIRFVGVNVTGGDNTAFIDVVQLNA